MESSDIVIEVAENQEESLNESMSSVSERNTLKPSFVEGEVESMRKNLASAKFNPYKEDVFSLGLTIL